MNVDSVQNEEVTIPEETKERMDSRRQEWIKEMEWNEKMKETASPSDEEREVAAEISKTIAEKLGIQDNLSRLKELQDKRSSEISELLDDHPRYDQE